MDNFFAYLQKLELLVFFSGYPLIYTLVFFIAGAKQLRNNFKDQIVWLLPFAYALIGTLYLGLQLKNLYPDYSFANIKASIEHPWLLSWSLLSILFWIPFVTKKRVLSLIHSLVFFFLLLKDMYLQLSYSDGSMLKNDMNVYTISLLLNVCALLVLLAISIIYSRKFIKS